ncbi:MAG: phytanoyl-CoA dioxygenase family protein, partial [Actinomycetes bacterium]
PGTPFETRFHTDMGYFHVQGTQVATTWVPLDAASPESGVVRWVRGSHLDPVEYRPNLFVVDDPIPGTEGAVAPDVLGTPELADRLITFDLEPGDLTVHHARTLHGAPANTSDRRRRAISVRYVGDDVTYLRKAGVPARPGLNEVSDGDPVGEPWCPRVWPR